jgi:hypothetical protein
MRKLEGGGSHSLNIGKKRWQQPNPRTKHPTGATNPRRQKQSTRLRGGGEEDENQEHLTTEKTKKVRCVKRVSSESSTPKPDEPKIN